MTIDDINVLLFLREAIKHKVANPDALDFRSIRYRPGGAHGGIYKWFKDSIREFSLRGFPELNLSPFAVSYGLRRYFDIENPAVQKQFLDELNKFPVLLPFYNPHTLLGKKGITLPLSLHKEIKQDAEAEKKIYSESIKAPLGEEPVSKTKDKDKDKKLTPEESARLLLEQELLKKQAEKETLTSKPEEVEENPQTMTSKTEKASLPPEQVSAQKQTTENLIRAVDHPVAKEIPPESRQPAQAQTQSKQPEKKEESLQQTKQVEAPPRMQTPPQVTTTSQPSSPKAESTRGNPVFSRRMGFPESIKELFKNMASKAGILFNRAIGSKMTMATALSAGGALVGAATGAGLAPGLGADPGTGALIGGGLGAVAPTLIQNGGGNTILNAGNSAADAIQNLTGGGLGGGGFAPLRSKARAAKKAVSNAGNVVKKRGAAVAFFLLLGFTMLGAVGFSFGGASSANRPTQSAGGSGGGDIKSCQFIRSDQNPKSTPIKSSILAGYFQEAQNITSVPATVLAAVARLENSYFVANADNNHDAFFGRNFTDLTKSCDPHFNPNTGGMSSTGALGLMQLEPPPALEPGVNQNNSYFEAGIEKGASFLNKTANTLTIADFCDPKKNIIISAGFILKKLQLAYNIGDGNKWDNSWNNDPTVFEKLGEGFYGCKRYGAPANSPCSDPRNIYSYGADMFTSVQSCQQLTSSPTKLSCPVEGIITTPYGVNIPGYPNVANQDCPGGSSGCHNGIDIADIYGAPVKSPIKGTVSQRGENGSEGRFLEITSSDKNTVITLEHLQGFSVQKGDSVTEGATVGTVGSTGGGTTGAHVHFKIKNNGSLVNPLNLVGINNPDSSLKFSDSLTANNYAGVQKTNTDYWGECKNSAAQNTSGSAATARGSAIQQPGAIYGINLGSNDTTLIPLVADMVSCKSNGWIVFYATDLDQNLVQKAVDSAHSSGINLILRLSNEGFTGAGGNNWGDLLNKITLNQGQIIYVVAGNEPNIELGQDEASATQSLDFLGALLNSVDQNKRSQIKIGNAPLAAQEGNPSWPIYLSVWSGSDLMNRIDFWSSNQYLIPAGSGINLLSEGPTVNNGSDLTYKHELNVIGRPTLPVILTESGLDPDSSKYKDSSDQNRAWNNSERMIYFQNSYPRFQQDTRILAVTPLNYINPEAGPGGQHNPLLTRSGPTEGGEAFAQLAGCPVR